MVEIDKNGLFRLVDIYIKKEKYTLKEFQLEILDNIGLDSSVGHGENDKEEQIEIWKDGLEYFYYVFDTNGNLINNEEEIDYE